MRPKAIAMVAAGVLGGVLAAVLLVVAVGQRAEAVQLPGVASQMRVFEQSPIPSGEVPPEVAEAQRQLPSRAHGEAIPGQVRRLGQDLGRNSVEMYAFPTTRGVVCIFVAERTSAATCVDSLTPATGNVQWGLYEGVGAPVTVFGLAADSVTDVRVLLTGGAERAPLRNNSFFWQSGRSAITRDDVRALLVQQADGGVTRLDLGRRLTP
jgi:hypothetical protein